MSEVMEEMISEKWYERLDRLLSESLLSEAGKVKNIANKPGKLASLVERSATAFEELKSKKRITDEDPLTRKVLQSGTLTDRVAAMVLTISEDPIQSTIELKKLVDMSGSKGRREAALALDALKDLLLDVLLPTNRRLNTLKTSLESIAVDRPTISNEILGLFRFEDFLKSQVWAFVKNLERACKDELIHHKMLAMKRTVDILLAKPEQERFLLSMLCSKMGDPDLKAAAQASHLLRKLTNTHPQMRLTIVSELEASILSSAASPTYVYESVIFLNQTILFRGDAQLANRLVDIYFALFERSLAVIEAGSNPQGKSLKKSNPKSKKKTSSAVVAAKKGLNSRLLAALLTGVNRALPFCDASSEESKMKFKERCDQLYRIVRESETFSNATQALALLFQLETNKDRFHQALNSKLTDPALLDGKKTAFLNLLYRSLKRDMDRNRVVQTIRLLLAVSLRSSASFAAASLFLLSNLLAARETLVIDLLGEDNNPLSLSLEEGDDDDDNHENNQSKRAKASSTSTSLGNVSGSDQNKKNSKQLGFSIVWELDSFRRHYHPTVQAFAKAILQRDVIDYGGDPLLDFSVSTFLDRFVYRNPKEKKLDSSSEPSRVFGAKGREQRMGKKSITELAVNTEAFHEKMAGHRPKLGEETDRFFFRYFDTLKKQGATLAKGAKDGRDIDPEDREDAFVDGLAEKLLKQSAGGLEVDIDDDIADEFSSPDEQEEDFEFDESLDQNPNFSDDDNVNEEMMLGEGFDDEDEDEEEDEEDDAVQTSRSAFADADDFAELLKGDDDDEGADKSKWMKKGKGDSSSFKKRQNDTASSSKPKKRSRIDSKTRR